MREPIVPNRFGLMNRPIQAYMFSAITATWISPMKSRVMARKVIGDVEYCNRAALERNVWYFEREVLLARKGWEIIEVSRY